MGGPLGTPSNAEGAAPLLVDVERRAPRLEPRSVRPTEGVRGSNPRIDNPPVYREERGRSIEFPRASAPVQSMPAPQSSKQSEPPGGGSDARERSGRQVPQGDDGERGGRRLGQ